MLTYISRRLLQLPIMLFGVTSLIFALIMLLTPEVRLSLFRGEVDSDPATTVMLLKYYHLDKPVPEQYWTWIQNVLQGNLGYSYVGMEPVLALLKRSLPISLELALWSALPVLLVGVELGIITATHHDKLLDQFIRGISLMSWSTPPFVFALLALMFFYGKLGWFPIGRVSLWAEQIIDSSRYVQYTGMVTLDALLNGRLDIFLDALRHLVLPVITLSITSWALLLRITRSSMLEELQQDYMTTARAKGLPERVVTHKHARRNAMIPVVTMGGLMIAMMLGGVVITESIFAIHGVGYFFAQAALQWDVATVIGFTLFYSSVILLTNLIVDIVCSYLDPRIRYS